MASEALAYLAARKYLFILRQKLLITMSQHLVELVLTVCCTLSNTTATYVNV